MTFSNLLQCGQAHGIGVLGIGLGSAGLVELHGDHQAQAADIDDLRNLGTQAFQACPQLVTQFLGTLGQLLFFHHVQHGIAGSRGQRVAGEGTEILLVMSGIEGAESNVRVLHVFRSADTVYLDCSRGFAAALSKLGQRNSQFLVTGIVRTMQDNFPPIVKVRFLIDGAVSSGGAPIDLTVPWQLPRA